MKKAKITDLQYLLKVLPLNAHNWYTKFFFDVLTKNSDSTNESDSDENSVKNCISFLKFVSVMFVFICFILIRI